MRMKVLLACACAAAMVAVGQAQQKPQAKPEEQPMAGMMKISATMQCPNSDPISPQEVGDQPGHMLALAKVKCTYSKGELGGAQIKAEEDIFTMDMSANSSRDQGYGVVETATGDKAFVRFQGTTTMKDKKPTSGSGTWMFNGGTGKLKGLKGKGSYKGTFKPDGSATFEITGDYSVAGK